jgi:hypothetical protein
MSRAANLLIVLAAVAVVVVYAEVRFGGAPPPSSGLTASEVRDIIRREVGEAVSRERPAAPMSAPEAGPGRTEIAEPKPPRTGTTEAGGTRITASEEPGGAAGEAADPTTARLRSEQRRKAVRSVLAKLESGIVSEDELNRLWETLPGSGLEAEAVAKFKSYVEKNPNEPNAHYGLGIALTSKLMGGSPLEQMMLSAQSDKAFTQALKLDDSHFGARFSKAISYTYYPAIAGKGPEAIKQFGILVERHGGDRSNPLMKDVYFNLGNEYLKVGNTKKARETYRAGLAVFPDAEQIREKLDAME